MNQKQKNENENQEGESSKKKLCTVERNSDSRVMCLPEENQLDLNNSVSDDKLLPDDEDRDIIHEELQKLTEEVQVDDTPDNRDYEEDNELTSSIDTSSRDGTIFLIGDSSVDLDVEEVINSETENEIRNAQFVNQSEILFPGYNESLLHDLKINLINVSNSYLVDIFLPTKCISDLVVVDRYLKLLVDRSENKIYAYPAYFMTYSLHSCSNIRYKYRKNIDIFSKEKIFLPIFKSDHWALFVVDIKSLTIYIYDSLDSNLQEQTTMLASYLCKKLYIERSIKLKPEDWRLASGNSPIQTTTNDSGIFVCVNAEIVSGNRSVVYSQEDIGLLRYKITYELYKNELITY